MKLLNKNVTYIRSDNTSLSWSCVTDWLVYLLFCVICQGYNNDQIAELIHISPKTVEKHKSNLFKKTDTNNTVNLIIYAFRNEIVKIHS